MVRNSDAIAPPDLSGARCLRRRFRGVHVVFQGAAADTPDRSRPGEPGGKSLRHRWLLGFHPRAPRPIRTGREYVDAEGEPLVGEARVRCRRNAWTTKSPPPFSYATYAATEHGGQLYLAASGNLGGGGPPATNFARYDPATDTWVIRASLFGIWGSALASANGKVYALGGVGATRSGAGAASANVNEYDPVTDKWTAAGRFGSARQSAGASLLGHDLYVAGGAVPAGGYGLQPVANLEIGVPRPK